MTCIESSNPRYCFVFKFDPCGPIILGQQQLADLIREELRKQAARKKLRVRILIEPGSAHAAADAHRDDAVFDLAAFHLVNQLHG